MDAADTAHAKLVRALEEAERIAEADLEPDQLVAQTTAAYAVMESYALASIALELRKLSPRAPDTSLPHVPEKMARLMADYRMHPRQFREQKPAMADALDLLGEAERRVGELERERGEARSAHA